MPRDRRPADNAAVLFALEFGLGQKCGGLIRWALNNEIATRVVAKKVLDHFKLANFAIMQKSRPRPHR